MPSSLKKVAVRPDDGKKCVGITCPTGTLFREEGLARLTASSNVSLSLIPYPLSLSSPTVSQSKACMCKQK